MQHPRNSKGYTKTLLWCLSFYDVLITVRWQRLIMASLWRPRASHWSNKKCVAQLSPCPFIWHITQYGFFKFVLQGQLWPKMLMKVNPSTHVSERLHILLWGLTHKNVIPYFLLCSDLYRIFKKNDISLSCYWYLPLRKIWKNDILQTVDATLQTYNYILPAFEGRISIIISTAVT